MPAPASAVPPLPVAPVPVTAPAAMPAAVPQTVMPERFPPAAQAGMAETGLMPQQGLLAAAYVPIQRQDSPRYTLQDALKNGTLFPGLNLPYEGYAPNRDVAHTPQGELMALGFVLNELALYLDTHPGDMEALQLRNSFVELFNQARAKLEPETGPLTQNAVMKNGYAWINDPWPWEK